MRFRRMGLTVAAVLVSAGARQSDPIERAAWLAGCWEQRAANRLTMEMWMPPSGGVMLGASRTVIGGATREFEHLRLSLRGDTLVYTALPSGQTETEFRATTVSEGLLVFENRAHDFPQVITYRRVSADSIVARVEGPGRDNSTRSIAFPMRRASCTTPPAPAPPPDTVLIDATPSPDGTTLLVVRGLANNNWEIFADAAGGVARRRLTDHPAVDYMPAWSPDGSRIAFVSVREGHQEIYTMRPDGSGLTQLTRGDAHNSEPTWSPDGRTIAFRSERGGRPQIWVMGEDGSGQRALTSDSAGATSPSWSPDGRRLLFSTRRDGHGEIFVMNAEGAAQEQLTRTERGHSGLPRWSPDGTTIAFWSTRTGDEEVFVMAAGGSNVRNVSRNPARDTPLGWTRDGAHILIRSTRDRAMNEIYLLKADGSEVVRVTHTKEN